jgi:ATP-dependent RNA helicase RhlE
MDATEKTTVVFPAHLLRPRCSRAALRSPFAVPTGSHCWKKLFMSFADLKLSDSLLRAVQGEGYEVATPIQTQAIPIVLSGRDLFGCAQTGTGKTAAFALPTLQRLNEKGAPPHGRRVRALVLAPTRELASQIGESFRAYGRFTGLKHTVIFGGVGQNPQVRALQHGVDILVATPGRLLDLMNQGYVNLAHVQVLILDEADQMLDMGFIHDLRKIVARVPRERQTLLFSATMPPEIRKLADQWLRDPLSVSVAPQGTTVERVDQSVYFVEKKTKSQFLADYLRGQQAQRALVFTRTKHGADKLVKSLIKDGIRAEAIHGNKSQNARERALSAFKSNKPPVLVATDIAARGLDVDAVTHVVNFDLPMTPEIYVHRIGRTARAGAEGIAITLCDREERGMLREIERLTRQKLSIAASEFSPQPGSADDDSGEEHRNSHNGGRVQRAWTPGQRPHSRFGSGGRHSSSARSGGASSGSGHSGSRHSRPAQADGQAVAHARAVQGLRKKRRRNFSQSR